MNSIPKEYFFEKEYVDNAFKEIHVKAQDAQKLLSTTSVLHLKDEDIIESNQALCKLKDMVNFFKTHLSTVDVTDMEKTCATLEELVPKTRNLHKIVGLLGTDHMAEKIEKVIKYLDKQAWENLDNLEVMSND